MSDIRKIRALIKQQQDKEIAKYWYLIFSVTDDPLCKLVLFGLCTESWGEEVCSVSIRNLSLLCDCSEATVRRKLRKLERKGFIKIKEVVGGPSEYTLLGFKEQFFSYSNKSDSPSMNGEAHA